MAGKAEKPQWLADIEAEKVDDWWFVAPAPTLVLGQLPDSARVKVSSDGSHAARVEATSVAAGARLWLSAGDGLELHSPSVTVRLGAGHPDLELVARTDGVVLASDLHAGSEVEATGALTCTGSVDGARLTATRLIKVARTVDGSELSVTDPEPGTVAVTIGSSTPNTVSNSRIVVDGEGDVVGGDVADTSIHTRGAVTVGSIVSRAEAPDRVLSGADVFIRGDVTGAVVRAESTLDVGGKATTAELTGRDVRCEGQLIATSVAASATATIGSVDDDCVVTLGAGTVGKPGAAPIIWTQQGDLQLQEPGYVVCDGKVRRTLKCPMGSLVVLRQSTSTTIETMRWTAPVLGLVIDQFAVATVETGATKDVYRTVHLVTSDTGVLELAEGAVDLHLVQADAVVSLKVGPEALIVLSDKIARATLAGAGTYRLRASASIAEASVDGSWLGLEAGASIARLEGLFAADGIEGYIDGDRRNPPMLLGIAGPENPSEPRTRAGSLRSVDVTFVPFDQLRHIEELKVLDPAPRALMRHARTVTKREMVFRDTGAPVGVRATAQWFEELAARTEKHSLTGDARSALEWSRHYLHHRRLRWWSPDRWVRYLHQAVGYGYRPLPALATLVLFASLISGMSLRSECPGSVRSHGGTAAVVAQFCVTGDAEPNGPADVARAWGSVLVGPAKLARLADAASPLPYFPAPLDTIVNIALGVTFLFTILALRNYFRTDPFT